MTLFWHFLGPPSSYVTFGEILPPPSPLVTWQRFLSTITSEITNKNCHVIFLLTPLPPCDICNLKCHILFEWPLKAISVHKSAKNVQFYKWNIFLISEKWLTHLNLLCDKTRKVVNVMNCEWEQHVWTVSGGKSCTHLFLKTFLGCIKNYPLIYLLISHTAVLEIHFVWFLFYYFSGSEVLEDKHGRGYTVGAS